MTVLKIVEIPDPVLREVAQPIPDDENTDQLVTDMLETMYDANGIGLAANQVGILKRITVIDVRDRKHYTGGENPEGVDMPLVLINPEITEFSTDKGELEEGCLSIPKQYANVCRPAEITVTYQDKNRQEQTLCADGLLAVCIQHEIDHLDGKLFIDYLAPFKRKMLLKKLDKRREKQRV